VVKAKLLALRLLDDLVWPQRVHDLFALRAGVAGDDEEVVGGTDSARVDFGLGVHPVDCEVLLELGECGWSRDQVETSHWHEVMGRTCREAESRTRDRNCVQRSL
jgi:hypothetical protein